MALRPLVPEIVQFSPTKASWAATKEERGDLLVTLSSPCVYFHLFGTQGSRGSWRSYVSFICFGHEKDIKEPERDSSSTTRGSPSPPSTSRLIIQDMALSPAYEVGKSGYKCQLPKNETFVGRRTIVLVALHSSVIDKCVDEASLVRAAVKALQRSFDEALRDISGQVRPVFFEPDEVPPPNIQILSQLSRSYFDSTDNASGGQPSASAPEAKKGGCRY